MLHSPLRTELGKLITRELRSSVRVNYHWDREIRENLSQLFNDFRGWGISSHFKDVRESTVLVHRDQKLVTFVHGQICVQILEGEFGQFVVTEWLSRETRL